MAEKTERKFSSEEEKMIFLASSFIALSISEGKTAKEIDLISLLLSNISFQLGCIADVRLLNDNLSPPIFPIV